MNSQNSQSNLVECMREHGNFSTNNDICSELMGDWGIWQFKTFYIVNTTKVLAAFLTACIIFTAPQPWLGEYKCDTSRYNNKADWISITHPNKTFANGTVQPDYCKIILTPNNTDVQIVRNQTVVPCESFKYNVGVYTSLVTQFDLSCSRSIFIDVSQSIHFFGLLVGTILTYELNPYLSPGNILVIGMLMVLLFGSMTGLSVRFWTYVTYRFITAVFAALSYNSGSLLITHITGGKSRLIANAINEQFWSLGIILMSFIGYASNNWSHVYVYICTPLIGVIILWNCISDSPVWHMERRHVRRIQIILEEAVRFNKSKKTIPNDLTDIIQNEVKINSLRTQQMKSMDNWGHLFSLKNSAWTVICLFISWSAILTCHYGTLLNMKNFGRENLFKTVAIAGFCEILGGILGLIILLCMKNKWRMVGILTLVCGAVNFVILSRPINVDGSHMLLDLMLISMVNKIGISACLCVLTTCTHELFPLPHKRRIDYGCRVVSGIATISIPFIGMMIKYGDAFLLSVYGLLTVIGGIFAFFINPIRPKVK